MSNGLTILVFSSVLPPTVLPPKGMDFIGFRSFRLPLARPALTNRKPNLVFDKLVCAGEHQTSFWRQGLAESQRGLAAIFFIWLVLVGAQGLLRHSKRIFRKKEFIARCLAVVHSIRD